jgi:hypothetical protein
MDREVALSGPRQGTAGRAMHVVSTSLLMSETWSRVRVDKRIVEVPGERG